ncbi:MAG TPA: serine/threonine-protein kinase [Amycolatopsis sp.]|uniref:serine/threonine protein kinase n=1 Tax=Amycolatopsis sp. TaxID=37632 RepID=UPI002F407202
MKPLEPGEPRAFGGYRVLAELGRGGMGRVLLGCGDGGRLVAVKVIHPHLLADEGFRKRFRREVEASRRVSGPRTAAVVDADPDAPSPWLASEFVPGPSLQRAVELTGPLPPEAALGLASGLAAALAEVHASGLVHRDLSPANVLLAADGPRVIDFGIARAADGEGVSRLTRTGWLVGVPDFMAPEQAEGGEPTAAADVFSLGSVLYFASTGRGPFAGRSAPQVLYNVVHAEPDLSVLPDELRDVVRRCLAKAPGERPDPAELVGDAGTPVWPDAVRELIEREHAEAGELLTPAERTAHFKSPTRILDPTLAGSGDQPRRFAGTAVGLALTVLVFAIVLAVAPWRDQSESSSSATSSEPTQTTAYDDDPVAAVSTSDDETTEPPTTSAEPDDGPFTASVGDCFADENSSGGRSNLHRDDCEPGNFKVRKRADGTSDTRSACAGVDSANWLVSWDATSDRDAMVLCLEYLYRDDVFTGEAGQCAYGNPDASGWHLVDCDRHNFEIERILHGTDDPSRCGSDPELRYKLYHRESRPALSVVVCLSFRYGDDGFAAKKNNCVRLADSGHSLTFSSCASANFVVTGYTHDRYDPAFCGRDGSYGWHDTAGWGEYLDYTVCLRRR